MKFPFEVGDIVEVIGWESSCSDPTFLTKTGVVIAAFGDDVLPHYACQSCAVEFDEDADIDGHECRTKINGVWQNVVESYRGQFFKFEDLAYVGDSQIKNVEVDSLL